MIQCPPEYKTPGLYVIDAIIRNSKTQQAMSQHQKQVFTARFSKNMCKTFTHLYSKSSNVDRVSLIFFRLFFKSINFVIGKTRIKSLGCFSCGKNTAY